ncbi:hypothetical protein QFZ58_002222 [Streptomyces sp. B1I3]|nr:hypothetical protein [Streptomyces sp. B1I3]
MARMPIVEHDGPKGESPTEPTRVSTYRSKANPRVTVEWRMVTWSKEQRLQLAHILFRDLPPSEGTTPPA